MRRRRDLKIPPPRVKQKERGMRFNIPQIASGNMFDKLSKSSKKRGWNKFEKTTRRTVTRQR